MLNIYYETPDNWLRNHDMGLRIRGANGRYEMTMKIAGRVVGGLHQRPEYNIDIRKPELELERFPAEVWPEGELPATLAGQVQPLFSTDFAREKWLVTEGKSRIEIALDLGEVKAGEFREPICELELELLEGDASDVLKLARKLVSQPGLRQGSLSKAARGYHGCRKCATRAERLRFCASSRKPALSRAWKRRWSWRSPNGSTMKNCGRVTSKMPKTGAGRDWTGASYPDAVWRYRTA